MSVAVENIQTNRRRASKAARWLTAACEALEHRRLLSGYTPLVSVASFVPYPNGENPQSAVAFDASGNLWGTTSSGGPTGYGTVFEIAAGSSTITTIATFNGTNGANPYAGVSFDSSGNLWGTTYNGGSGNVGTVYEIPKGSSTITTVASFNSSNGAHPAAGVTFDASGNLWGTTYNGGSGIYGTIFEIAKGSTTITTITSFYASTSGGGYPEAAVTFDAKGNLWGTTAYGGYNFSGGLTGLGTVFEIPKGSYGISGFYELGGGFDGANPKAGVTFDASGNLWGTTYNGGSDSGGTVFEIANGSNTMTTVASLQWNSQAALTFDSSGNLWGTTRAGGQNDDGAVFEITKANNYIQLGASFNVSNGSSPEGAVAFDANGNLWGTTYNGGSGTVGTVFEVAKGSYTVSTFASFIAATGQNPAAGVTFDAGGDLWGTTYQGGAINDGTIYEIVKGTSAINTITNFNGSNGAHIYDAVTFDANGNLWGTTFQNGPSGWGTVFEIAKASSTITTVASFNDQNGAWPEAPVTFDASGNLWGTTSGNGSNGWTVFEIAKGSNTITTVANLFGFITSPVTFDASGNLWGTTQFGGNNNSGSVYEIAKGSTTLTIVASFNTSTGDYPRAGVTFDASGNLWGTTTGSGAYGALLGDGTVFEIAKGSSTITPVASFNASNGGNPIGGVAFDASGNLWGTTYNGGSGSVGTVFEIAKGTSTITTVATFNGSNGAHPAGPVAFDASGNIWGTTYYGGAANAGTIWELSLRPTWLSDPAGNDTWNTASHTLTVNDPSTIIADPGVDQPIIQANGSTAVVTINPSSALQIHLGGLSLTNGASVIVTSLGAAPTATNHRVLVLGLAGATSAPPLTIDATSKLDLTDNDLVGHDGSLSNAFGLLTTGFASGWLGDGIVSSKAGGSGRYALGVSQPASSGTFDNETVGISDVEIRYTYYGDANLDGHVDGSDYSKIDFGYLNKLTSWNNGDFNYDGVINGSDYTLIDNTFNSQGTSLAASIAPQMPSTIADMTLSSAAHNRLNIGGNAIRRSRTAWIVPDIFSTDTPIALLQLTEQSIELSIQKRDLLDQLSFAQ